MTDYDEVEDVGSGPPFPATVRIAGVIWLMFGTSTLVGVPLHAALLRLAAPPVPCVWMILLFGVGCLFAGYRTVTGRVADPLGNAVSSVLLGVPLLAATGLLAAESHALGVLGLRQLLLFGLSAGLGGLLLVAGALAYVGRDRYLAWRQAHCGRRAEDRPERDND